MSAAMQRDLIAGELAGLFAGVAFALVLQLNEPFAEVSALLGFSVSGTELVLHLLVATLAGGIFAALFRYSENAYAALASSGVLFGLLLWVLGPLTLAPLIAGEMPSWSISEARAAFPNFIGHLLFGGLLGLLFCLLASILSKFDKSAPEESTESPDLVHHIVILGGGFGGISAAQALGARYGRDSKTEVTLVSESNYMLFTPLLAEVASSALEPQHVSVPVRAAAADAHYRYARIEAVDPEGQLVKVTSCATGEVSELRYTQLILGLGSVPEFHDIEGMEEHAFTLKSLQDASNLRQHVLRLLAIADQDLDAKTRRELLTFVVIGGGFAGTEIAADLLDFVRSVLHHYKNIDPEDLRFVLVHSRDRILPELDAKLALYAQVKLKARGVELLLNRKAEHATAYQLRLDDETEIPTRTLIWTAGNRPDPLLQSLGCELNATGAVMTDRTLRVPEYENIWAVGDCAHIPDAVSGQRACPPSAQHAIRQGQTAAENVIATLDGTPERARPYTFNSLGTLVGLGRYTAVAEVMGVRFSGFFAWFLWRSTYLFKLPGFQKKARVMLDWTLDLFFPRDITLTESEIPNEVRYRVAGVSTESPENFERETAS